MLTLTIRGLFVLPLCLALTVATAADPLPKAPRTDVYGDPLPEGALVRFGTSRLRHAGLSDFVFLQGGKTVLSSGSDRVLRFWDVATGQQTRAVTLQGSAGPGRVVTLSPDGKTLVAHDKAMLVFWEVESGKEIKSLPAPKHNLGFLYFSPDGKTLAVGRSDWRVSFWDWQNANEREIQLPVIPKPFIQYSMDSTFHGSFSPDGKWFVAGASSLQPLGIFEVATGREALRLDCQARTSTVSPDNQHLAVSSSRNDQGKSETVLRLFDLPSGNAISEFPLGHDYSYFSLAFSPDGKRLACGASDKGCVLDCATGRVLHQLPDRPWQLAFTPDGKMLTFSAGYRLRLWDTGSGKELHQRPGDFNSPPATAVSPDGRFLVEADWLSRDVRLWDAVTGRLLRRFQLEGTGPGYVRNLAFSADGRTLFAGRYQGLLHFWDVDSGEQRRIVQLRDGEREVKDTYFYFLHITADGKQVATLDRVFVPRSATRLAHWDATTGKLLRQQLLPHDNREAGFSTDGRMAAVSLDHGVTVLDVGTGAVRVQIANGSPAAVAFSADDRLVAVRRAGDAKGDPASVTIWEIASGKEVVTPTTGRADRIAFVSDNRILITTDHAHIHLWDLATGKERRRIALPITVVDSWGQSFIRDLSLSPDGRRAFTALADGSALAWDISLRPAAPLVAQTGDREIAAWWADLADRDAARAYAAIWRLTEAPPAEVIELLRDRVKPVAEADFKKVRQLIAELDSDNFKVRDSAFRQLEDLGSGAVPALREAQARNLPLEVQRRLEKLLARAEEPVRSPEILQRLRAIQALERLDATEARRLLGELAGGMPHADETRAAQRALERVTRLAKKE